MHNFVLGKTNMTIYDFPILPQINFGMSHDLNKLIAPKGETSVVNPKTVFVH